MVVLHTTLVVVMEQFIMVLKVRQDGAEYLLGVIFPLIYLRTQEMM